MNTKGNNMNIIELAKQADLDWASGWTLEDDEPNRFETFANLVAAAARADEREECAKFIEPTEEHRRDALWGYIGGTEGVELLDGLAAAIRARGTT